MFLSNLMARSRELFLSVAMAKKVVQSYGHDLHALIQMGSVGSYHTHACTTPHADVRETVSLHNG